MTNFSTNVETINNNIVLNTMPQTFAATTGNLVFNGTVAEGANMLTLSTGGVGKTLTMNGIISGTAGVDVTGGGTTIFSALNNYAGTTTIDAGATLQIATGGQLGTGTVADAGTLQFNSSGNLTVSGAITGAGALQQIGSGTTTLSVTNPGFSGTTTVNAGTLRAGVAGALTNNIAYIVNGGTLDLNNFDVMMTSLSGIGGTVSLGSANLTLMQGVQETYGGVITGTGTLHDSGAGLLILTGNNNYTGTTTIDAGSTIQVGNGGTTGSLGTGSVVDNGNLNFNLTGTSTVSGAISGTGNISTGTAGTVILTTTNTYSGTTTIGTGSTLQIGNGSTTSSIGNGTGAVTNNGSLVFDNAADSVVSNAIGGTGTLIQEGTGKVTLATNNSYSGDTTINAGSTLQVGNAGTSGSLGTSAVHDNGTLIFNRTDIFAYSNVTDGTGGITQAGTGTVTLGGANTYSGATNVNQGTLQLGVDNALPNTTTVTLGNATGDTNGTLDLNGHNATVTGLATAGAGTSNTVTNNSTTADATLTFTTGTSTFSGIISDGTNSHKTALTVTSGDLTLSGINTYTGVTMVNGGSLTIDTGGSLASGTATTVGSGGTFVLNGTANGTVTNNGTMSGTGTAGSLTNNGTLTPGDTTAMMKVSGTFTNSSTGTVNITVDGTNTSGIDASTTGSIAINGGTLNVDTSNAILNHKYNFLMSSSPVTGSDFTTVTPSSTSNFVLATTGRDGNVEFFLLQSNFVSAGQTQNERAVGAYLDAIAADASGELSTIINDLQGLSPEQAAAALEQMTGDIHATLGQLDIQGSTLSIQRIAKHLRGGAFAPDGAPLVAGDDRAQKPGFGAPVQLVCCNEDGTPELAGGCDTCVNWTGWVQGFGLGGNARSDGNAPGVNYNMGGTIAGLERWVDDCHLLGFYAGYTGINVPTAVSQISSVNGGQVGGYFMADDGFSYYSVIGGFQFDRFSTHRGIDFTGDDEVASSDYTGWQTVWYAERGFSFRGCNQLMQPFVGLQYDYLRQDNFTENGAGAIDLQGNNQSTNSLRSILGARAQMAIYNRCGHRFLPELHAMWIHEYIDSNTLLNAHFVPIPTGSPGFTVQGLDFGRDWALAGTQFTWEMSDGCSMFVSYDCQANTQQVAHIGSGGIGYSW